MLNNFNLIWFSLRVVLAVLLSLGLLFVSRSLMRRSGKRLSPSRAMLLFPVFCFGLFLIVGFLDRQTSMQRRMRATFAPEGRVARYSEEAMSRALADPQLRTKYETFISAHRENPELAAQQLTVKGMKRLDNDSFSVRANLSRDLVHQGDPALCAGFLKGQVDPVALSRALEALPDEKLRAWDEIAVRALLLELQQVPYRQVAEEEAPPAIEKLYATMTQDDHRKVATTFVRFQKRENIPDRDVCEASKIYYTALTRVDAETRAKLLRFDFQQM